MKLIINLKNILEKKKMTTVELSEITWLSRQQISTIKNWKSKRIELTTIHKLMKAFKCTPNDLFKVID